MLNGFITICLLLTALVVMGCASTKQQESVSHSQSTQQVQRECNSTNTAIAEGYPWTIAGHHATAVARYHSLGIIQSIDEPHQFTLCANCPCPSAKQTITTQATSKKTESSARITKTIVRFGHASSELSESDQKLLSRFYKTLTENSQLTITGFTDDAAPGGTITNESLALNRATTVRDFLVSLGFKEEKTTIKASPLCCYIASNDTDSGRALNRRVEIHTRSLTPNQPPIN